MKPLEDPMIIGYELWAFHGDTDAYGRQVRSLSMERGKGGLDECISEFERLMENGYKPRLYQVCKEYIALDMLP